MTTPAVGPTLTTERMVLTPPVLTDFDDFHALWSDPQVVRHIGGRPFTEEDDWKRLSMLAGSWVLHGMGYWTARDRADGRFVGQIGVAMNRRALPTQFVASFSPYPETGWVMQPQAQGRGLATEGALAAVAWADAALGAERTVCLIAPANAASLRVAERCGYRRYAETEYHGEPTVLLERFRPQPG